MKFILPMVCALSLTSPAFSAEWDLVWSDEFDVEGLPDPNKWDYEVGFVRNAELQYYTQARLENARVEKGMLVIEGKKESYPNARYKEGSEKWQERNEFASYTAASLITRGKASWTYGRMEIRAKIPHGKGIWPAIWTLGENSKQIGWPRCGEIDIMEFVGKTPDKIHATVHYSKDGKHAMKGSSILTEAPFDDFHVYAMEWYEDRIDFFYDKKLYHSVQIDIAGLGEENPFRKPHYLLINLALGGSWGGPLDDDILPQQYLIDYVRIYQAKKAPVTEKAPETENQ